MNESKLTAVKLFISLLVPLVAVTLGGFIVYQTPAAFFYAATGQATTETNGPVVIYYALTLVIALMLFLMRQRYKWTEIIAFLSLSLVFSLSMQKMTPGVFRPLYLYFIPLLIFFGISWLVLKYIFLNRRVRVMRLLIFSLAEAAAFAAAFELQYVMLKLPADSVFLQAKFVSGLMLFIFMGVGLAQAEYILARMERKSAGLQPVSDAQTPEENSPEHDETD
jgi:hypothetical protein